jgi:LPS-assembly protein
MLLLALAVALPLLAQPQQERAKFDCGGPVTEPSADGVIRCEKDAVVTYQDMRLEADWMAFNPITKEVTAGDRVHFTRGEEQVTVGKLSFNLDTRRGASTDANGQIEGWFLKAGENERRGDGTWYFKKPTATACEGDCPVWRFTWRDVTVTPGKNVSGHGVALRFRNVPVFYFPTFSVPTSSKERSSGFLLPSIGGSSSKGRFIRQSFFWAMGRSYDTTFVAEYFTKRGPTGTIDFRGVPDARSSISVNTLFAIDTDSSDEEKKGGYRTRVRAASNRGTWRAVANADFTSDFEFRQIYEEGFNAISSPIEQSTVFGTRNSARSSLNFLYNRTAVFYPSATSTVLRKFPAVDLQLPTNSIGRRIPVYFSLDGGFAGTARRDSQINTPPLMQRFNVRPSVQIPLLRSSLLTWSHEFAVRETLYTHSLDPDVARETLSRGVFDYSTKVTGPQLEKSYGKWKHLIEPTIEYRYVTGVNEFQKTIVVDETDLVTNTNEIEYGITNRFIGGHEFLTWRIAQKMYFDPTFGGALQAGRRNTLEPLMDLTGFAFSDGTPRRFSPIVSIVRIATTPYTSTDIQVDYDTLREEFRSAGILGGVSRGRFNSSIGYFFNKRSDIQSPSNQLRALVSFGSFTSPGLSAGVSFAYDIHRSLFQGATGQVGYNADCYGLGFELAKYALGARHEFGWRASISLKNLGSFGTLRPQERLF